METIQEGLYLFPNLSRAFEVALSSNLLIKPYGNDNYPEKALLKDLKITGIIKMFSTDGDVQCLIHRPEFGDVVNTRNHIGQDAIVVRHTDLVIEKPLPKEFENINSARLLIKTAWEKLDLTLHDYNMIILMSGGIARLDGSVKIKTEHVAEAVHYRSLNGFESNDVIPVKL